MEKPWNTYFSIKYNCLVVYKVPKCYKRDAIIGDLNQSKRISMNITVEVKHIKTTFFKGRLPKTFSSWYYEKSVYIRSYSGPYFPAFGLNNSEYRHFSHSVVSLETFNLHWIRKTHSFLNQVCLMKIILFC